MTHAAKDALAKKVVDDWLDFQDALGDKRRYPKERFYAFFRSAWTYAEGTRKHRLIHRAELNVRQTRGVVGRSMIGVARKLEAT